MQGVLCQSDNSEPLNVTLECFDKNNAIQTFIMGSFDQSP